jgi:hypothetical protein
MGDQAEYEYNYHAPRPQVLSVGGVTGEVKTNFAMGRNMDQMKSMVSNANPEAVHSVSQGWKDVHEQLVGAGGAEAVFKAAVDHILQHWEGASADAFASRAKTISQKISDGAQYAHYTSVAMEHAATVLEHIKPEVEAMQKPSEVSSLEDHAKDLLHGHGRSDSGVKADLAKGVGTQQALDQNRGDLSKGKEAQLEMAVKMETLAASYSAQSSAMGSWTKRARPLDAYKDEDESYPGGTGGATPVPAIIPLEVATPTNTSGSRSTRVPTRTVSPSKSSSRASQTSPREASVSGGVQKPLTDTKSPARTAIDGTSGRLSGVSGGGEGFAGGGARDSGSARGGAGGFSGGLAGGFGGVSRRGSTVGGEAVGRARTGGRGMSGGDEGSGLGAMSGSARGGGLARERGGVVGAVEGGAETGRGTPGGSGLHQSRGATGAGKAAQTRSSTMGGRGSTGHSEEEEGRESTRPDYLVEDEETWIPQRYVAPPVIE